MSVRMSAPPVVLVGLCALLMRPPDAHAQTVDAFNPGTNGRVQAIVTQPNGQILIGGAFSTVAGSPRPSIARLNADGSLDATFNPGTDGVVRTMVVQANGQILIGGDFSTVAGVPRRDLARLNADGSIDVDFIASTDTNPSSIVLALAVQADGKIWVGGLFTTLDGTACVNLARLSALGVFDASFGGGTDGLVRSLLIEDTGAVVVGGEFSVLGDGNLGTAGPYVGRLTAGGAIDTGFLPTFGNTQSGTNPTMVRALTADGAGRLYVLGAFTHVNSQPRQGLARFEANGTLDLTFQPAGIGSTPDGMVAQADGRVIVLSGSGLARLTTTGAIDNTFSTTAHDAAVWSIALQQDGRVLYGGDFTCTAIGPTPCSILRTRIARLANTGTATESLTLTGNGSTLTWLRGGIAPEVQRVAFATSTDGLLFTFVGNATRTAGGWTLSGLSLTPSPGLRLRARGFYGTDNAGAGSIAQTIGPASGVNVLANGDFSGNSANWQTFATPTSLDMVSNVTGGVFQFYRIAQAPGTPAQAVVFQQTGMAMPGGAPLLATFDLGNTDSVRKRISVLVHDADFSDLHVCTFWLPPNLPLSTYSIRTHTTKPWVNATLSFYAASANPAGNTTGFFQIDNISLAYAPPENVDRTRCIEPTPPAAPGGPSSTNLLTNGDFSNGTNVAPWSLFGQIQGQVTSGVFEFIKLAGTPAGEILQQTGQALPAGEIITATLQLGNSSGVRKRVTVILHDSNFSDLSACTFWLPAGQALSTFTYRTYTTQAWSNATLSIYPATAGSDQWIRLDNAVLVRSPSTAISGTECLASVPASAGDERGLTARTAGWASSGSTRRLQDQEAAPTDVLGDADAPGSLDAWIGDGFEPLTDPTDAGIGWVATEGWEGPRTLTLRRPLSLPSDAAAVLAFESWLPPGAGRARLEISTDDGLWETLTVIPSTELPAPMEVDLASFAGLGIRLRFVLDPPDGGDAPGAWRIRF